MMDLYTERDEEDGVVFKVDDVPENTGMVLLAATSTESKVHGQARNYGHVGYDHTIAAIAELVSMAAWNLYCQTEGERHLDAVAKALLQAVAEQTKERVWHMPERSHVIDPHTGQRMEE